MRLEGRTGEHQPPFISILFELFLDDMDLLLPHGVIIRKAAQMSGLSI